MTSSQSAHIDPTDAQVSALLAAAQTEPGPVIMTNLLRFDGESGRASYETYARAAQPHLDRVGAEVVYVGNKHQTVIGADDDTWWDTILLVRYPSRQAFLEMVLDPEYIEIAQHRSNALSTSALIATDEWRVDLG